MTVIILKNFSSKKQIFITMVMHNMINVPQDWPTIAQVIPGVAPTMQPITVAINNNDNKNIMM